MLVAYKDGGWYAAKVTGNAAAGAKCPIKYDSDDSKESVELKRCTGSIKPIGLAEYATDFPPHAAGVKL